MRSQAVRGAAWERPVLEARRQLSVFGSRGGFLSQRGMAGGITDGLRGCCRRRRVRARGVGFDIAREIVGLRSRTGCARRRMSRRGCVRAIGSPWFGGVQTEALSSYFTLIVAVYSVSCWRVVSGRLT